MKLRLAPNSIRLRLAPDEVAALGAGDAVETAVDLPGSGAFRFRLELRPGAEGPAVEGGDHGLVVVLPRDAAREWTAGKAPGVYAEVATGGAPLSLVVETDLRP